MSIFRRLVWKAKKVLYDFDRYEIGGVPIMYHEATADDWDKWEPVLEEWLPQFEEAGWTDGLNMIRIGETFPSVPHGGTYRSGYQVIDLHVSSDYTNNVVIDGTKEATLIHELTHHIHIMENFHCPVHATTQEKLDESFGHLDRDLDNMLLCFEDEVSEYAGINILEAVAETSTAITLGYEIPEYIVNLYEELNGPKTIKNWHKAKHQNYIDHVEDVKIYNKSGGHDEV